MVLRPIRILSDHALVDLTQGQVAQVDIDDVARLSMYTWRAVKLGRGKLYAAAWTNPPGEPRKAHLLHRFLLNAPAEMQVDHIDGDGLNCRRANLRLATNTQNQWNVGLTARNSSGFKGVRQIRGRWRAQIGFNGKQLHIGYFATAEQAHQAYIAMSEQLHGEFSRPA